MSKSFGIGTAAGALGSLAGMGGGFVMIPLMTSHLLRLSQHQAHGTSLAAVTATGCAGALAYQDFVDYEAAAAISATAMLTAVWGARATVYLSATALRRALGVLLLVMGPALPVKAYLLEQQEQEILLKQQPEESVPKEEATSKKGLVQWDHLVVPAAIGIGSGFLAGIFGVGGGTLVVPALTYTHKFPSSSSQTVHHQALATSLAAMTLPAAIGTLTHARAGNVAMHVAPGLALGALCGGYLGGKLAVQTTESTLRWGFSILLTVLGIRTLRK
jgi:uncharacterized membrane protein YfcA